MSSYLVTVQSPGPSVGLIILTANISPCLLGTLHLLHSYPLMCPSQETSEAGTTAVPILQKRESRPAESSH